MRKAELGLKFIYTYRRNLRWVEIISIDEEGCLLRPEDGEGDFHASWSEMTAWGNISKGDPPKATLFDRYIQDIHRTGCTIRDVKYLEGWAKWLAPFVSPDISGETSVMEMTTGGIESLGTIDPDYGREYRDTRSTYYWVIIYRKNDETQYDYKYNKVITRLYLIRKDTTPFGIDSLPDLGEDVCWKE